MKTKINYDSEHLEQVRLFAWIRMMRQYDWRYETIFAIPNGGARKKSVAAELKAEGVEAGIPDIMCAVPSNSWPGLFLEMKSLHPQAKLSQSQKKMIPKLKRAGYKVEVPKGFKEAQQIIIEYLKEEESD